MLGVRGADQRSGWLGLVKDRSAAIVTGTTELVGAVFRSPWRLLSLVVVVFLLKGSSLDRSGRMDTGAPVPTENIPAYILPGEGPVGGVQFPGMGVGSDGPVGDPQGRIEIDSLAQPELSGTGNGAGGTSGTFLTIHPEDQGPDQGEELAAVEGRQSLGGGNEGAESGRALEEEEESRTEEGGEAKGDNADRAEGADLGAEEVSFWEYYNDHLETGEEIDRNKIATELTRFLTNQDAVMSGTLPCDQYPGICNYVGQITKANGGADHVMVASVFSIGPKDKRPPAGSIITGGDDSMILFFQPGEGPYLEVVGAFVGGRLYLPGPDDTVPGTASDEWLRGGRPINYEDVWEWITGHIEDGHWVGEKGDIERGMDVSVVQIGFKQYGRDLLPLWLDSQGLKGPVRIPAPGEIQD